MVDNKVLISVLVIVTTARVSMCHPKGSPDADNLKNFVKENQMRSQHKCGPAQPRIIYLHEIVGDEIWERDYKEKMEFVKPFGIILHRCENSGCCSKYNERCRPANETDVTLTFMVSHKNGINTSKYEFRNHHAKNHTLCECQVISDQQIKK